MVKFLGRSGLESGNVSDILTGLAGVAVYALIMAFSMGGAGSIMFPVSRLGMVVSVILAVLIYREPVTVTKLIGLGLGVSSIIVLSR